MKTESSLPLPLARLHLIARVKDSREHYPIRAAKNSDPTTSTLPPAKSAEQSRNWDYGWYANYE